MPPRAPEGKTGSKHQANKVFAGVKSADVARSVNSGVHKCVDFGKEAAQLGLILSIYAIEGFYCSLESLEPWRKLVIPFS